MTDLPPPAEYRYASEAAYKRGEFDQVVITDRGLVLAADVDRGTYTSPVVDAGHAVAWGQIAWSAEVPARAALGIRTRHGANGEECQRCRWSGAYGSGEQESGRKKNTSAIRLVGAHPMSTGIAGARCLQFRVEFVRGKESPVLQEVTITRGLLPPAGAGPHHLAVGVGADDALRWLPVPRTARYEVLLVRDSAAAGGEPIVANDVSLPLAPLELDEGTWSWRVRAVDEDNRRSPWSLWRQFEYGLVPAWKAVGGHPRLFMTADDLPRLRELIASNDSYRQAWELILAKADEALTAPIPSEADIVGVPGQHSGFHELSARVARGMCEPLAFAYLMTKDERYAARAREVLLHLVSFSRWAGVPFGDRQHFDSPWRGTLETGGACKGVATAYDWLYDYLSPADRTAIREGLIRLGIEPLIHDWADPATASQVPRHQLASGNWWSVCNSGAGVAALALLDEVPEARRWVRLVADAIRWYLVYPGGDVWNIHVRADAGGETYLRTYPNWGEDGGYVESIGYLQYGLLNALHFIDALKRVTGEDLSPHINRKLIDELVNGCYREGDGSIHMLNFNDSGHVIIHADTVALLARHTRSGLAAWLPTEFAGACQSIHWMLAHDDSVAPTAPPPDRDAKHFRGIGWAIARDGFDPGDSYFAAKFHQGRGHEDLGQFVIYPRGRRIVIDPGVCPYADPIYHTYLARTPAHNVVTVDDLRQMRVDGEVTRFTAMTGLTYVSADLTAAYQDLVSSWQRSFVRMRPDCWVVWDRIQADDPHDYRWLLHFDADWRRDGDSIVLTRDGVELRASVIHPDEWTLEERDGYIGREPKPYLAISPAARSADQEFLVVFTAGKQGTTSPPRRMESGIEALTKGARHVILFGPGRLRTDRIDAEGELVAVTFAGESEEVRRWLVVDGTLAIDGGQRVGEEGVGSK